MGLVFRKIRKTNSTYLPRTRKWRFSVGLPMNADNLKTFLIRLADLADLAEHAKSSRLRLPVEAVDRQDKAASGSTSVVASNQIRDHANEQTATTPRRSVRKLRGRLLIDPTTWPRDAAAFALLLAPDDLPIPFDLRPGVKVIDAARFLAQLRRDIALGPRGPRARFGALQGDLVRLRDVAMAAADQGGGSWQTWRR